MSVAYLLSPAPVPELPDLLEDAGPPLLEQDIRSALLGPDAAADPYVARFVGSVLTLLADRGDTEVLTTYLAPEPGGDATYEVEVLGLGELIATDRVGGLSAVDAVREAAARTGVDSCHVSVLARGANGLGRHVLSAPPEGPLEYVYPGLLSFEGERRLERHALEAWEAQLAQWRDEPAPERPEAVGEVAEVLVEDLGGPKGDEDMVAERSFVKANGHSRWSLLEHNGHDGVAQLAWAAPDANVTRSPAVELARSLRSALGTAEAVTGCAVAGLERDDRVAQLAEPLRSAIRTTEAVTGCMVTALEQDSPAAELAEPLRAAVHTVSSVASCVVAALERGGPAAELAEPLRSAVHTVSSVADCVVGGLEGERPHIPARSSPDVPAPSSDERMAPVVPVRPLEDRPPSPPVAQAPPAPPVAPPAPAAPSSEDLGGSFAEVCQELAALRQCLGRLGDDRALLVEGAQAMVRLEQAIEVCPPTALDDGTDPGAEPAEADPPLTVVDDGDLVTRPDVEHPAVPEPVGGPSTKPDVEPPDLSGRGSRSARPDPVTLDPRQVDKLVDAVALRLRDLFEPVNQDPYPALEVHGEGPADELSA